MVSLSVNREGLVYKAICGQYDCMFILFFSLTQLTIMDTGSRERYQSLTAQYYRRTNVILLICSLDNEDSLTRLTKWYAEAQYYIDNSKVIFAVVGMKSDLSETQREVSEDMLYDFARHFKKFIFEVSARTGSGVDEMLRYLCQSVIETYLRGTLDGGGSKFCYHTAHSLLDLVLIFILVTTITLFTLLCIGKGRHKEISYS